MKFTHGSSVIPQATYIRFLVKEATLHFRNQSLEMVCGAKVKRRGKRQRGWAGGVGQVQFAHAFLRSVNETRANQETESSISVRLRQTAIATIAP